MLLVRVSMPFGEQPGHVYIGPALKYSSPILSLDLSKNTGNGCCFPLAWTLAGHSSKLKLTNQFNRCELVELGGREV